MHMETHHLLNWCMTPFILLPTQHSGIV